MQYDGDFIIGGPLNRRVTPDFRLGEYASAGGRLFIHRDLVAAVQVIRDGLGAPVRIAGLRAAGGLGNGKTGLFVWLEAADSERLDKAAGRVRRDYWLGALERRGNRLYVEIPDPAHRPAIRPNLALDYAVLVTAGFETSGDPYRQVTGNFDGAGLSFGPLQVNFGTGTLPVLFERFRALDESALRRCFGADYAEWEQVLKMSRTRQIAWADGHSTGARKAGLRQRWKGHLQAVGGNARFRRETRAYAYDIYGRKLIAALAWLRGLAPIPIDNFRCLAALYDLCVQQGGLAKAYDNIRRRVEEERPDDQFGLVRIAAVERGRKATNRWRADCISRRLTILERAPKRVTESGETASRGNRMLYLVRNVGVRNVEQYLL